MINNKKIGILVVNYNNLNYTKNCISDLKKQLNQNFELWLVDQNSNEKGTFEFLNEINNTNVKVIKNKENLDLNRVWNYFYDNCKCEYLCFLNNDVRLTNNFIDDTIKVFDIESSVGIVIHVTNNLNYTKSKHDLNYEILKTPLYQGWDFSLRRKNYTKVPESLRIFGGDDFIFADYHKKGFKIAMVYSSPIIHYKEKTRNSLGNIIHDIQKSDIKNFHVEIKKHKLNLINSTFNTNICNKYPPDGIKLEENKKCLFTTIINQYDNLNEVKKINGWDYVCFTNDKNLKSNTWKIIYIDYTTKDKIESSKLSRFFKTNYHKYLSSYDFLIYADARMEVIGNLDLLLNRLKGYEFSFMIHPEAKSIKEEMKRVLGGRLEKKEVIEKIKDRYEKNSYKYDNGLFAGGVLIFRNCENVKKFFLDWWYEIKNYSHRDQLSLNYVLSKNQKLIYNATPFRKTIGLFFKQNSRKSKRPVF